MVIEPHPRSTTARGGKIIANNTCKQVILFQFCRAKLLLFSDIRKSRVKKETSQNVLNVELPPRCPRDAPVMIPREIGYFGCLGFKK